ncbi:hypothetical protein HYH02_001389 [Chlamydomonas schloesseri]|uniref:Uncharacterized protein n=1 Tax=Chlamydomonas schloesseri TaxID=2026947 RepID=A0A835WXY6_9CHLO|nr:hypothetical protein HYH02_001389 [Chlamydomonas schloesseri]|eukprot:KAG2454365.1 hypothetical protein HYH02_001389 [Chlamydomonas schloesseri]
MGAELGGSGRPAAGVEAGGCTNNFGVAGQVRLRCLVGGSWALCRGRSGCLGQGRPRKHSHIAPHTVICACGGVVGPGADGRDTAKRAVPLAWLLPC